MVWLRWLGSVRLTLSDAGAPLSVVNYDPWGTAESGSVPTVGFTGELQDSATGLMNLRVRWYSTAQGRFMSRDPFAGAPETPYSLHQYAYGVSDPISNVDPSGNMAIFIADWFGHRDNPGTAQMANLFGPRSEAFYLMWPRRASTARADRSGWPQPWCYNGSDT